MGSGSNDGNFLNPKNLVPAIMTGGLSYAASSYARSAKPPNMPAPPPPPDPGPEMRAFDDPSETAAQRQKKLAALQYGFASTMTKKNNASATLGVPAASALKSKTGQ